MTLYSHELRAGEPTGPVADALAEAEDGQISYLTRGGRPIAALVSIAELAELQAAQDARDIVAMMDADDDVHDAMAAALDSRATEDIPPEAVRGMWEAVKAGSRP